ncbi:thioredoxin domain-containing protein [Clostridium rectalis]|uniref:thioredoxin domain-containing protein n=1 Tax=Clostridium rectalis TaxID=2040295 RepID=UPI000F638B34|nr:thioredoxin domain-containing protein [Clostridium rectalis]
MYKENPKSNRLINEKSPYLLQHAYNPVNWYPWSEEAFKSAKIQDKPIFLSIGYSTCHWCHVMERESFEDEEVAKKLNENFICIKVDREERPDIDSIYMTFCQATTGSGGWPLNVMLTADKKPFFVGTYFPKENKYGRIGLIELIDEFKDKWRYERDVLTNFSKEITEKIKNVHNFYEESDLNEDDIKLTFKYFKEGFDSSYGGFYLEPKFPTPHKLMFLLRYWYVYKDEEALYMVESTLKQMYKGGIFDHIGYGFARYSTDRKWLIPHFEKMLYDNALLIMVYTEVYQITGKEVYKEIAEMIIRYILREMKDERGGFYSAEDADSEGEEGKFYLWTKNEIIDILGKSDGDLFCDIYDITKRGNFKQKNIPNLIRYDIENIDKDLKNKLLKIKEKLFQYRKKRIQPYKDDKILTAWNGLAIASLAYAGRVYENKDYIDYAKSGIDFIFNNIMREDNRLFARYRDGERAHLAYLEDYAFVVWSLIEIYESTFCEEYLEKAVMLTEEMINLFWDKDLGGFYIYGNDGEKLILRPKDSYDFAIPSGNSVAAFNMIRLYNITENQLFREKADKLFKCFAHNVKNTLEAHSFLLTAYMYNVFGNEQTVICRGVKDNITKEILSEINKIFLPFNTVILKESNEDNTYVHVCKNFSCSKPVFNLKDFIKIIEK